MKSIILVILFIPFVSFSQIEKYNTWSQRSEHSKYLVGQQGYEAVNLIVYVDSLDSSPDLLILIEEVGFENLVFSFTHSGNENEAVFGVLINEMSLNNFKEHLQTVFPQIIFLSEEPYSF